MTGHPRVAVVSAVDIDNGHGGAPMRVRALRSALATFADVVSLRAGHDRPCPDCRASADDPFPARSCDRTAARIHETVSGWPADVVIVSELLAHRYARELAERGDVPVIFDMHNVEYALRRDIAARAPAGSWPALNFTPEHCAAVRQVEHDTLRAVHQVWTCSQNDRDAVRAWYPDVRAEKIHVVPNAVHLPATGIPAAAPDRVLFTGRLDYYPNIEAVQLLAAEIGPDLRRRHPELTVVVAGADATEETHAEAAKGSIVLLENPIDTASLIRESIMAVPLRVGGGSRFKILEALAVGSPVVSTAKGAEGLDLVPGRHFLEADSAEDFVAAIGTVTAHQRLRGELARAGWAWVRRSHSVAAITETVERQIGALRRGDPR